MSSQPDLSIIVLSWNTEDLLARCLRSVIHSLGGISAEIIVVDNASSDASRDMVRADFPEAVLIENSENEGFARANNRGMRMAKGRYFLLLNSDAFPEPGAIRKLVGFADSNPRCGLLGSQLLNQDGSFQASHTCFPGFLQEFLKLSGLGRLLRGPWYPSHGPEEGKGPQQVDYVEGACMLVRPDAFQDTGGLDEGFFMYAEEVDWCFEMRKKGWEVWYAPSAKIVHLGGGSSGSRSTEREVDLYVSRVHFFRKHYGPWAAFLLQGLIYVFTAIKIVVHGPLIWLSGGRRGRRVPSLGYLRRKLREV